MWVILFNAVDDFGVREVNEQVRMGVAMQGISGGQQYEQIETVKHKLLEEALHGALRIAGLVCILFAVPVCMLIIITIDGCLDIKRLSRKSSILLCVI